MTGPSSPPADTGTSEQLPPAPHVATADAGGSDDASLGAAADEERREFTMTLPFDKIASTAAAALLTPATIARRVLPAKGGLPLYAGLGGLALVGVIEWPVAVAAGAGYGLARLLAPRDSESPHQ
jgi:hypothetical protein